jgi:hypothetical protein
MPIPWKEKREEEELFLSNLIKGFEVKEREQWMTLCSCPPYCSILILLPSCC